MERKCIGESFGKAVRKVATEVAVLCGKPEWIDRGAERLGLSGRNLVEAGLRAASNAEIVYGNYQKGLKYTRRFLNLLEDS